MSGKSDPVGTITGCAFACVLVICIAAVVITLLITTA